MGIKDFEPLVSAALPDIVALVPSAPAARLGRWEPTGRRPQGTRVQTALDELGDILPERLLGALELTVDRLVVDVPSDLVAGLARPTVASFGVMTMSEQSATKQAVSIVEQVHPGATDVVVDLVEALRDMASVPDAAGDEAEIAARHGATHLALAVVVSTAVLRSLGTAVAGDSAAIVGVALGAAAIVLPTVPKPHGYAPAVLAKRRAEYLLPRHSGTSALVKNHQFWITEGSTPANVDFSANGLVAAVPDGVTIRTGLAEGHVHLSMIVLAGPPPEIDLTGHDEVVEISWTAPEGGAVLFGDTPMPRRRRWETPPWPGDYRVRVHATGRDDAEDSYHLVMWQAPAAPQVVYKKTDRLGHRLRREPEPLPVVAPDAEYRWIEKSSLDEAATITVVQGVAPDEVIRALGGDPTEPVSIESLAEFDDFAAALTVLAVDGVVLAVEENGFRGADNDTMVALSRNGKAASLYWNINGNFRLILAERGELLFTGEPGHDPGAPHTEDLDFDDYRHGVAKGLTVLARFAGRGVTAADMDAIHAADQAYMLE
ncbi:DUF6461 domain-containing protein [Actinophytocola sp.]|uniref:DUF6461 domain-containing protein n=1 Tax=Actinophytocola sp. TaxID=1872138 RepID=UPI002ED4A11B